MEMTNQKYTLSAAALHIMAMALMLCDHLWATVVPGNQWMTSIGRIAFPIFAFMAVEGYFHTHNLKHYLLRMLVFALISEIPFNLMYASQAFYPIHQNVIFTLLIGLLLIHLNEMAKKHEKTWLNMITGFSSILLAVIFGILFFADYGVAGLLTILVFYFFRERKWYNLLFQIAFLYYINVNMLAGQSFTLELFGHTFEIIQQGFALIALIPIWLYQGRQGYHKKWFQYFCYAFYPLHMLILGLIVRLS